MRAFGCAALFAATGRTRAYIYTHTSDKRVVCVCVCVGTSQSDSYLVDSASSHMLVSKIKPCMCKYERIQTVKLRMAH